MHGGEVFVTIGVLLLIGLAVDAVSRAIRIPQVTLLVVIGLAVGVSGVDLLPGGQEAWFPIVTDMALVMLGFLLGQEFQLSRIRSYGGATFLIAGVQALFTAIVVLGVVWALGTPLVATLALGGIAVATDPLATYAVVRSRPVGNFERRLLAIVALDDVLAMGIYSVLIAIAAVVANTGDSLQVMATGAWEILGALLVGTTIGLPAAYLTGRVRPGEPTREEAIGVVLICLGVSLWLGVSPLLAAVALGAVVANLAKHHTRTFREIESLEGLVLVLFFILAGASLDIGALGGIGLLVAGYILARSVGKIGGAMLGARLGQVEPPTSRWLGVALLPQAGVAIGLALATGSLFPTVADTVIAVAIVSTVVFELLGPLATSLALKRGGTVSAEPETARFSS
ncbi:MAG: cation:proton antiporter [Acidobacteria bacterium]|nr:cation:proton antiporter [Acidobacteriota bacterium]